MIDVTRNGTKAVSRAHLINEHRLLGNDTPDNMRSIEGVFVDSNYKLHYPEVGDIIHFVLTTTLEVFKSMIFISIEKS